MNLKNMKRGETTEQISLFKWAERNAHVLPCLSLMYHVPNEGKRTNGAVLKAMGLKTGVPDVVLPRCKSQFPWPLPGNEIREEYANQRPKGVYGGIAAAGI